MDTDPIGEIKGRLDIVEFISQYVTLKKTGINLVGLCPFHDERTPSFTVSPERQTFKCFGCSKGGDVLTFVMEKEGVDFPTALSLLAEKTGVTLPEHNAQASHQRSDERSRLFALNSTTATFWHTILLSHPQAATVREYLQKKRGVSDALIKQFMIGAAPTIPATTKHLTNHGFTSAEMKAAGDPARFAHRIIFPIGDITGRVVGFTGRIMPSMEEGVHGPTGPKYWNTPETLIFKKSEILYGLHLAKDSIRKTGTAIIAEGQMDVIGLHQVGLTNAVASSGTALTDTHLATLKRFTNEVAFAYDADSAGKAAAERGFALALAHDLTPSVIALPNGEDPGSLAVKEPKLLQTLYEQRQPIIRWLLTNAVEQQGTATPAAKRAISKAILPWIYRVTDAVEQRAWLDVLAEAIAIAPTALEEELHKLRQPVRTTSGKVEKNDEKPEVVNNALTLTMGIIIQHPTLVPPYRDILPKLTADTPFAPIVTQLLADTKTRLNLERTVELVQNEAVLTTQREYGQSTMTELTTELSVVLARAIREHNQHITAKLSQAIAAADTTGDSATVNNLMERLRSDTLNPPHE